MAETYQIVLLLACLACAMSATSIFVRDPDEATNRYASAIVMGGAWWAEPEPQHRLIYSILYDNLDPMKVLKQLMTRDLKHELDVN